MQPLSQTDLVQRGKIEHIFPNCESPQNKSVRPFLTVLAKKADTKNAKKEDMIRCQSECSKTGGHFENLLL